MKSFVMTGDASFDITNPNTVNAIGEWRYDVTVSYPGGVTGDWAGGSQRCDLDRSFRPDG